MGLTGKGEKPVSDFRVVNPSRKGIKVHGCPSLLSRSKIKEPITHNLISFLIYYTTVLAGTTENTTALFER